MWYPPKVWPACSSALTSPALHLSQRTCRWQRIRPRLARSICRCPHRMSSPAARNRGPKGLHERGRSPLRPRPAHGAIEVGASDPAHFAWVTHAWNAVVVPSHVLSIGLLAAFEAAAGVLAISGGRRTQLGYLAVTAFYLARWLFGWIEAMWVLIMLPAMLPLVRGELAARPAGPVEGE